MKIAGRSARQLSRRAWMLGTAPVRAMPDFVIIGAQKAGTTSLFEYLSAHEGVFPATKKEVQYFSHRHGRGALWYRSHFATRASLRRATTRLGYRPTVGEASPYYLAHPLAAERAYAEVPEARLVVLLREPVDRAYSHWRMVRRQGREPLEFGAALAAEEHRLAGERERIESGTERVRAPHQQYSYLTRGRYADDLGPWIDRYGRDQVLILQAERFFSQPDVVYREVLTHLGIPMPEVLPAFTVHHASGGGEPISPETAAEIRGVLAEDNARLFELTGIDYR